MLHISDSLTDPEFTDQYRSSKTKRNWADQSFQRKPADPGTQAAANEARRIPGRQATLRRWRGTSRRG
jgi:hypothetical protein